MLRTYEIFLDGGIDYHETLGYIYCHNRDSFIIEWQQKVILRYSTIDKMLTEYMYRINKPINLLLRYHQYKRVWNFEYKKKNIRDMVANVPITSENIFIKHIKKYLCLIGKL